MSEPSFEFRTVPHLVCRPGAAADLATVLPADDLASALVVTDAGVRAAGLTAGAEASLAAAGLGVAVYDGVVADPPERVVYEALAAARSAGADLVVGLGGGSSLDVAKLVAVLLSLPAGTELAQIYGLDLVPGPRTVPLVQVPTTAGTGSEVTAVAVVTAGEEVKLGVNSPQLLADVALLDADLTLSLPPHVTAHTGIDAMVHAIEAYTSKQRKNPLSDALAVEALRLLKANVARACEDGSDRAARGAMLLGANLAGQAFSNAPVAAVHALAYPVGGRFHVPHGLSNALVLPHVLRFNGRTHAAAYRGLEAVFEADDDEAVPAMAEWFEALSARLGVERRLREVGIGEEDLSWMAESAMQHTRLLVNNPCEVSEADALAIYRSAW
ncbi:MAG TPA: iron-containing alcohol dehydrogenase [Thermoanaerobaculia bacterium]|nr:iron-containing alcohol dehydrogenase [Thermoanaerobaculia bacterium]